MNNDFLFDKLLEAAIVSNKQMRKLAFELSLDIEFYLEDYVLEKHNIDIDLVQNEQEEKIIDSLYECETLEQYEKLSDYPQTPEYLAWKAAAQAFDLLVEEKDKAGAQAKVEEAFQKDPNCIDALFLQYYLKPWEEAKPYIERGADLGEERFDEEWDKKNEAKYWEKIETRSYMRCLYLMMWDAFFNKDFEETIAIGEDLLEMNPSDTQRVRHLLSVAYLIENKTSEYQKFIKAHGVEYELTYLFSKAFFVFKKKGKSEKAIDAIEELIDHNPFILDDLPKRDINDAFEHSYYLRTKSEALAFAPEIHAVFEAAPHFREFVGWIFGQNEEIIEQIKREKNQNEQEALKIEQAQRESEQEEAELYNRRFILEVSLHVAEHDIKRTLSVPVYTSLFDLHLAIQGSFAWEEAHLFEFIHKKEHIDIQDALVTNLLRLGIKSRSKFYYLYDFGDSWYHEIKVKKTIEMEDEDEGGIELLSGTGMAPLEDCGSWQMMLDIFADKKHPDHSEMVEWAFGTKGLPKDFDPSAFDLEAAKEKLAYLLGPDYESPLQDYEPHDF